MDITAFPTKIAGIFSAPSSKSELHRILIAAFLSSGEYSFDIEALSDDIRATLNCLESMGAQWSFSCGRLSIERKDSVNISPTLDCSESGTTLRLLMPVAAALCERSVFLRKGSLKSRPIDELVDCLLQNGCSASYSPLTLSGRLSAGNYSICGDVSSQYISGLLLALPLLNGDSTLEIVGNIVGKGYIELTLDILRLSGISYTYSDNFFSIKGNQKFNLQRNVKPCGDWSNASFFLCLGALFGSISVNNLDMKSSQPDRRITEILGRMGASFCIKDETITVFPPEKLSPVTENCSDILDVVPIIAAACVFANGKSELYGLERLKIKESNRLQSTVRVINNLGGNAVHTDDRIIIYGGEKPSGGITDVFGDHRLVMTSMLIALCSENTSVIKNADSVNKSFPNFFEKIRGTYEIINDR